MCQIHSRLLAYAYSSVHSLPDAAAAPEPPARKQGEWGSPRGQVSGHMHAAGRKGVVGVAVEVGELVVDETVAGLRVCVCGGGGGARKGTADMGVGAWGGARCASGKADPLGGTHNQAQRRQGRRRPKVMAHHTTPHTCTHLVGTDGQQQVANRGARGQAPVFDANVGGLQRLPLLQLAVVQVLKRGGGEGAVGVGNGGRWRAGRRRQQQHRAPEHREQQQLSLGPFPPAAPVP